MCILRIYGDLFFGGKGAGVIYGGPGRGEKKKREMLDEKKRESFCAFLRNFCAFIVRDLRPWRRWIEKDATT